VLLVVVVVVVVVAGVVVGVVVVVVVVVVIVGVGVAAAAAAAAAAGAAAAAATHLIFAFLWAPENRHIGGVFAFFDTFGAKTANTHVPYASEAQNHGIYEGFSLC